MQNDLGKFDVIYADIPFAYAETPYFKKSLAIQYKYPTLSNKDILNLDVESLAKKDCWLFFWSTWAGLPFSLKVVESWGFTYRTTGFVWAKKTKNGKNAKTYGRCCTQGSTEIVLCGKRGSPKRHAQNIEQLVEAKTRGNSVKPDEIYDSISKIVEDEVPVRKIELFARQQYKDWYALGNDEALNQPDNDKCLFGDIRDIVGFKE